jgi:hypothetical protein
VDGGHVFHCSLSLSAEERQLTDQQWAAIADDFMTEMGLTEDSGRAPARSAAVRRGLSKNGNDHIYIVAGMVRDDGTKWNSWKSKYRSQQITRRLEKKHHLNQLGTVCAERGFTAAEQGKAARQGLPEVERHTVARKVRTCAAASDERLNSSAAPGREGCSAGPATPPAEPNLPSTNS